MYMKKIKQVEELETKAKGFQHLAEKHAAEVRYMCCLQNRWVVCRFVPIFG